MTDFQELLERAVQDDLPSTQEMLDALEIDKMQFVKSFQFVEDNIDKKKAFKPYFFLGHCSWFLLCNQKNMGNFGRYTEGFHKPKIQKDDAIKWPHQR